VIGDARGVRWDNNNGVASTPTGAIKEDTGVTGCEWARTLPLLVDGDAEGVDGTTPYNTRTMT
jgi:hypothetical protein